MAASIDLVSHTLCLCMALQFISGSYVTVVVLFALSSVCCDEIPLNACSMCVRVGIRIMSSRAYLW